MKRMILMLSLLLLATSHAFAAKPDELFAKGLALIERNCADCYQHTRAGLEDGIAAVKQALDDGFAGEVAAYKALADGYNTLALVFIDADSGEYAEVRTKQHAVYKRLLEIAPRDAQVRIDYSHFLADRDQQITQLEAAVEYAPESIDARYLLAAALIDLGRFDAALAHARAAITTARSDIAEEVAKRLGDRLERAGRADDAEQLRDTARARQRKAN